MYLYQPYPYTYVFTLINVKQFSFLMLGSVINVIKKLKNLTVFFKNRKRFIFERLSQDNFSKNLLGFMFRNSKWFNYLKVNINKLPIKKVKKTLSNVFLFIGESLHWTKNILSHWKPLSLNDLNWFGVTFRFLSSLISFWCRAVVVAQVVAHRTTDWKVLGSIPYNQSVVRP